MAIDVVGGHFTHVLLAQGNRYVFDCQKALFFWCTHGTDAVLDSQALDLIQTGLATMGCKNIIRQLNLIQEL